MALRKLTQADINSVADYIRDNAKVMTNDKGKEFIGLTGFNHEIADLAGQLRFGYFGLSEIADARARASQNAAAAVKKLSPEERKALLASLAE